MNARSGQFAVEGVRQFHRSASVTAPSKARRSRQWVFAGMLLAAAGVVVWRCVSGTPRRT